MIWNDEQQYQAELERRVRLRLDAAMAEERGNARRTEQCYKFWLYITIGYGVLVTWFAGLYIPGFRDGCSEFGHMITDELFPGMLMVLELPARVAHLADMLPHDVWAAFVYWAVLMTICGVSIWSMRWCIGKLRQFARFYRQHMADWISLEVALISVAVMVFFAGAIQSLGINAVVAVLLTNACYTTVRSISICRHRYR